MVNNTTSRGREILSAIKQELCNIKRISGYNYDVNDVTLNFKRFLNALEDGNCDVLLTIFPSKTTYEPLSNCKYTVGVGRSGSLDGWPIIIGGYIHGHEDVDDDGSLWLLCEDLASDIIKCVTSTNGFGLDYVHDVVLKGKETYVNVLKTFGEVYVMIDVKFDIDF